MVKKALFADVFYQVEFHDRVAMDAEQEKLVIDEIAASLGASREGKRILRGRNLYWGIVDDASMVEVAPEAYKANLVRRKGERAIPVNATVTVSPP